MSLAKSPHVPTLTLKLIMCPSFHIFYTQPSTRPQPPLCAKTKLLHWRARLVSSMSYLPTMARTGNSMTVVQVGSSWALVPLRELFWRFRIAAKARQLARSRLTSMSSVCPAPPQSTPAWSTTAPPKLWVARSLRPLSGGTPHRQAPWTCSAQKARSWTSSVSGSVDQTGRSRASHLLRKRSSQWLARDRPSVKWMQR